eukprot:SAG22_NODE_1004_length_6078_cov_6.723532_2_plen_186_part_00
MTDTGYDALCAEHQHATAAASAEAAAASARDAEVAKAAAAVQLPLDAGWSTTSSSPPCRRRVAAAAAAASFLQPKRLGRLLAYDPPVSRHFQRGLLRGLPGAPRGCEQPLEGGAAVARSREDIAVEVAGGGCRLVGLELLLPGLGQPLGLELRRPHDIVHGLRRPVTLSVGKQQPTIRSIGPSLG